MSPRPLDAKTDKAQQKILQSANRYRRRMRTSTKPLGRRHLNHAVCIVRRHKLLKPETIAAAGFNPKEKR